MRIMTATQAEQAALVELLHELHLHYNPTSTVERSLVAGHLTRHLLAATSPTKLVVAWSDEGAATGLAAVVMLHSLVEPDPRVSAQCLLKELFVSRAWRSRGVGRALMEWVVDDARAHGCSRIDWNVKASNARGIGFYERLGGRLVEDRVSYRLAPAALATR
jgi:GNAT superfamily N-acetyltransferase